jgi:hypothetical protein
MKPGRAAYRFSAEVRRADSSSEEEVEVEVDLGVRAWKMTSLGWGEVGEGPEDSDPDEEVTGEEDSL